MVGKPGVTVRPDQGIPAHQSGQIANWQKATGPSIVLTFDDGPSASQTPKLLQILAKHNIKAVFFVLGTNLKNTSIEVMRSAYNQGHQIGNHSFSHSHLPKLSDREINEELGQTDALIGECSGSKKYFRPPYGDIDGRVRSIVAKLGFNIVMWDVDTLDWKNKNPSWIDIGLKEIKSSGRSIVLNHDIHKSTVDNMENFIMQIRKKFPDASFVPLV